MPKWLRLLGRAKVRRGWFNTVHFKPWPVFFTGNATRPGARDEELLTDCLADLDRRGWDLDSFLLERPEISRSLGELLRAAALTRQAPPPVPSPAFRARSRQRVARWAAQPRPVRPRWQRMRTSALRSARPITVPLAAGLLLLFGVSGVWSASAEAMPSSPLYSAKLAFEQVQLATAFSPERRIEAHLLIAERRLQEAEAVTNQGYYQEAESLVRGSDQQVAAAQQIVVGHPAALTTVPVEITSKLATVEAERQRVNNLWILAGKATPTAISETGSSGALVSTGPLDHPDSPPVRPTPARSLREVSGDPDDRENSAGNPPSQEWETGQPGQGDEASPDGSDRSHQERSAAAGPAGGGSDATATPTATSDSDRVDQLARKLIAQALDGDTDGAAVTARQYAEAVQADRQSRGNRGEIPPDQNTSLQNALRKAPKSTQAAIESALEGIRVESGKAPATSGSGASQGSRLPANRTPVRGVGPDNGSGQGDSRQRPDNGDSDDPSDAADRAICTSAAANLIPNLLPWKCRSDSPSAAPPIPATRAKPSSRGGERPPNPPDRSVASDEVREEPLDGPPPGASASMSDSYKGNSVSGKGSESEGRLPGRHSQNRGNSSD